MICFHGIIEKKPSRVVFKLSAVQLLCSTFCSISMANPGTLVTMCDEAIGASMVPAPKIEDDIRSVERTVERIETQISTLVSQRDAAQASLTLLLAKRDRFEHAARQAAAVLGTGAGALSTSTARALVGAEVPWTGAFDWDARVAELLAGPVFRLPDFRAYQREIINATVSGRDCFVVLRTGGGKSLTYQLPAILQGGITLVVSPLLSLITDQVEAMNRRAPGSAAALTSATDRSKAAIIHRALKGKSSAAEGGEASQNLRLVYVTPERVSKSKQLMAALEAADQRRALTRFVIDEAHCCSQWGHDFRSDYAQLHVLRKVFPRVPILALTATAPPALASDVCRILLLDQV